MENFNPTLFTNTKINQKGQPNAAYLTKRKSDQLKIHKRIKPKKKGFHENPKREFEIRQGKNKYLIKCRVSNPQILSLHFMQENSVPQSAYLKLH